MAMVFSRKSFCSAVVLFSKHFFVQRMVPRPLDGWVRAADVSDVPFFL